MVRPEEAHHARCSDRANGPPLRLAFGLDGVAFAAAIAAGAVAAWALVREPPRTRAGRGALGLAITFAVSVPMLGLLSEALCLEEGTALGGMVLGAFAREP